MELKVSKAKRLEGVVRVPGDKSISHRALILGGVAEGETRIKSFLPAADCLSTLSCLKSLGVQIKSIDEDSLVVEGRGLQGLTEPGEILDVGNSGTTLRILPGILAGQNFFSVLTGDASVRNRPMGRIIDPLREMGAKIWGRESGTYAPIAILGGPLQGISYLTPVPSAQVKSAVLLAGLLAEGITTVSEQASSRDHTERMLQLMGARIEREENVVRVTGGEPLRGVEIDVPGDVSSAAFFIVAAAVLPRSKVIFTGVGINPTRSGVLKVLEEMGVSFFKEKETARSNEPRADLMVEASPLSATTIEESIIPSLIDELPILAVAATQAEGTTVIRDAEELRVKETDRISAMYNELTKMGAKIEQLRDGWIIKGPTPLRGAVCESYGDHRIAMALAIAGLIARGKTTVKQAGCVAVSYPGFERILRKLSKG